MGVQPASLAIHTYLCPPDIARGNNVTTLLQVSARTGAGYGSISSVIVDLPNGPRTLSPVFVHGRVVGSSVYRCQMKAALYIECISSSSVFLNSS